MIRCGWVPLDKDYQVRYHDEEWGVPVYDDGKLFEMLILEGAQAGLSWDTILKKRQGYRTAFDGFDPAVVARYSEAKVAELLGNPEIVRNKLKVRSAIRNAGVFLHIQEEWAGFHNYLWNFVDGTPIKNFWQNMAEVPVSTSLSDVISKDMKKRGMNFIGTTIIYAYMQAVGLVNDHTVDCFRHSEI